MVATSKKGSPALPRARPPAHPHSPKAPRAAAAAGDDALARYRDKRSAGATAEPFAVAGKGPAQAPWTAGLFVVQQHAATRLHFDLRLELGGVLVSWAVPKGPSTDPGEKRLAILVEEHPLDYADFEGTIAKGNYGAGAVIVWDRGRFVPVPEPEHPSPFADGKLLFELQGHKLRGRWALVRTKRAPKQWLLMKKPDGHAGDVLDDTSVLSGRTVTEVRDGLAPGDAVLAEVVRLGCPKRALTVDDIEPMLAQLVERAPRGDDWVWEIKVDGYRALLGREHGRPRIRYARRGREVTPIFPEIALPLATMPYDGLILDGELAVLGADGRASFARLGTRANRSAAADLRHAAVHDPVTFVAFDLLAFAGHDLRGLPLGERKRLLAMLLPKAGPLRVSEHLVADGDELLGRATALGLEGLVGKRLGAPYKAGRQATWVKLKGERTGDFVVIGALPRTGRAGTLGSLALAWRDAQGALHDAGNCGSGITAAVERDLLARLGPLARKGKPAGLVAPPPGQTELTWVAPELVVEARFSEWTANGTLRHPVFVRVRDDKRPEACEDRPPLPDEARAPDEAVTAAPAPIAARPAAPEADGVAVTNARKVFWPDEGLTKGDLVAYYRAVAPALLPVLADRPLVLTRFPDGIRGKSFFQQDAPSHAPPWLRTESMWSSETGKETRFLIADDPAALVWIANTGAIVLHVWHSRVASLARPDWLVIDLDPKSAPFAHVVTLARALHELCDELGLPSVCKTSGRTGLHVLVPLGGQTTFDQARDLALLLGQVLVARHPELATLARTIGDRGGRVYVDCLQNGHGKLIVAPYSVRAEPGAPVSTPLAWREVTAKLEPRAHTIATVPARLAKQRQDPLAPLFGPPPDLLSALERLTTLLGAKR